MMTGVGLFFVPTLCQLAVCVIAERQKQKAEIPNKKLKTEMLKWGVGGGPLAARWWLTR
jgi:hypothetical protein